MNADGSGGPISTAPAKSLEKVVKLENSFVLECSVDVESAEKVNEPIAH